jgi:hypothetical protein
MQLGYLIMSYHAIRLSVFLLSMKFIKPSDEYAPAKKTVISYNGLEYSVPSIASNLIESLPKKISCGFAPVLYLLCRLSGFAHRLCT